MMLREPGTSQYDLNFKLLGFQVRIAWGFWLVAAILGWEWSGGLDAAAVVVGMDSPGAPVLLLVWAVALFVSILVHELGHCLAFHYYGIRSRIVLYHFGGLAVPDSFGSWQGARQRHIGPKEQIVISAAGPGLQLALGLFLWAVGVALGVRMEFTETMNWLLRLNLESPGFPSSSVVYGAFESVIWVSTAWAVLNLAPILPLDGGRIAESVLKLSRAQQPTQIAHMISIGTGALLGLWFLQGGNTFGIMFLLFAASNWQAMQFGQRGF